MQTSAFTQWANEQTAELRIGSFGFLLQNFYVQQHAGNFMMSRIRHYEYALQEREINSAS